MADFDWKISVFCILRMTLLAVFIKTVTSEGVRLQDVRLRPLPVPLHCQSVNHCKEHENDRDLWIDLCFNHYCKNDETVHCMEVENGKTKVIYFCSGPRFCDVGLTDKAVYNATSDQVLLTNIECPEPYFQPHPDFCNKTCRYKHRPTPAHVVILFPGNSSRSAIGVCNSSEGYIFVSGPNAPSVFSIDEYRDPCIFRWDLESIGCSKEEDVCPNGTCVAWCPPNLTRDLCDCLCKPENETLSCQHSISDAWISGKLNISTTTHPVSNYITASPTSETTNTPHIVTRGNDTVVIVILSIILVGVIVVVLILVLKRKGSSNGGPSQPIIFDRSRTNIIEQAETVIIGAPSGEQAEDALLGNNVSDHQEEESSL